MVQTVSIPPMADVTTPVIELRAVTLAHGRLVALSRASLAVPAGSFAAVVGPIGSGKSSLLRSLVGQLAPRSGEIRVLGRPPREGRGRVAYVPPAEEVDWSFPISLAELVMFGRYPRLGLLRRPGAEDHAVVRRTLEQLGLLALADCRISALRAEERRSALLARALARDPALVLLDEPWPSLGSDERETWPAALRDLCRSGATVLVATGQLAEARRCDWLVLLNGAVVADGPPAAVLTADNLRAAYGDRLVTTAVPAVTFAQDG